MNASALWSRSVVNTVASWLLRMLPVILFSFSLSWLRRSPIRVTWRIHMCDMTHSFCDTWLIPMFSLTHSYAWRDVSTCVTRLIIIPSCVTWLVHMRDMTCPYVWHVSLSFRHVWHDSFICVPWRIHTCNTNHCSSSTCDMARCHYLVNFWLWVCCSMLQCVTACCSVLQCQNGDSVIQCICGMIHCLCLILFLVPNTHETPYLYRSFSAQEPYN